MTQHSKHWIIRIAGLGMLGGMCLSPALWGFADRGGFPLLPVFGAANLGHWNLFQGIALLTCLVAVIIFPAKKLTLPALITCIIILCALDLNRLQPWVWFYLLLFISTMIRGGHVAYIFLLAGMYCWSGINKTGPYFVQDNFPWFCEAFSITKSMGQMAWAGYAVAITEALLGLGLLWPRTRKPAVLLLMLMHLLIVAMLLKLEWNFVVIPWNLSLLAILGLIAKQASRTPLPRLTPELLKIKYSLPIFLSCLAPAFYCCGAWPHGLSWNLYSNTQAEATFYSNEQQMGSNPVLGPIWDQYAFNDGQKLLLDDWAMETLQVPMFAANHSFEQMGEYLCTITDGAATNKGLLILQVNQWNPAAEQLRKLECR